MTDLTALVNTLQAQNQILAKLSQCVCALEAFIVAAAPIAGPTGSRPALAGLGQMYFDTTLGIPVWWKGAVWVNASGASV